VFVLASVFIPRSAGSARYLRDQVPGIDVPEEIVTRLEATPKEAQAEEGLRIALELVEAVRSVPGVRGVHLMSIKQEHAILRLIEEAGLLPRPKAEVARPPAATEARVLSARPESTPPLEVG
jgi:methylenetetrahydrofolate reductase (NADPH)